MDEDDQEDWVQLQEMIGNEEASMSEIKITGVNKQQAESPFQNPKKKKKNKKAISPQRLKRP